jgi:hypothetical protein
MKGTFTINVWDNIRSNETETSYDLKKIKIIKIDKFTGDVTFKVEFVRDKK